MNAAGLSVGGVLALYKLYCGRNGSEGNREKNVEQLVEKLVEGLEAVGECTEPTMPHGRSESSGKYPRFSITPNDRRTKPSATIATISEGEAPKKLTSETC